MNCCRMIPCRPYPDSRQGLTVLPYILKHMISSRIDGKYELYHMYLSKSDLETLPRMSTVQMSAESFFDIGKCNLVLS